MYISNDKNWQRFLHYMYKRQAEKEVQSKNKKPEVSKEDKQLKMF